MNPLIVPASCSRPVHAAESYPNVNTRISRWTGERNNPPERELRAAVTAAGIAPEHLPHVFGEVNQARESLHGAIMARFGEDGSFGVASTTAVASVTIPGSSVFSIASMWPSRTRA